MIQINPVAIIVTSEVTAFVGLSVEFVMWIKHKYLKMPHIRNTLV